MEAKQMDYCRNYMVYHWNNYTALQNSEIFKV